MSYPWDATSSTADPVVIRNPWVDRKTAWRVALEAVRHGLHLMWCLLRRTQ